MHAEFPHPTVSPLHPTPTSLRVHTYILYAMHVIKVNSGQLCMLTTPEMTQHPINHVCQSCLETQRRHLAWRTCPLHSESLVRLQRVCYPVTGPLFSLCQDLPWAPLPMIFNKFSCFALAIWIVHLNFFVLLYKEPEIFLLTSSLCLSLSLYFSLSHIVIMR